MSQTHPCHPQALECVLGVCCKRGSSGSKGRAEFTRSCVYRPAPPSDLTSPKCTEGGPRCLWVVGCAITQTADTVVSRKTDSRTKEQVWVVPENPAPEPLPEASGCPAVPHLASGAPATHCGWGAWGQPRPLSLVLARELPCLSHCPGAVPPPDAGTAPEGSLVDADWLTLLNELAGWLA